MYQRAFRSAEVVVDTSVGRLMCPDICPGFHAAPVRSSMNSRQLAGRSAGLAFMARRMALLTRSDSPGERAFGGGKSSFVFFIQQSSGLVLANGICPVTIM